MFTPYIHFKGHCREAMETYQRIFGGELTISTYGDMPDMASPEMGLDRVMHSGLMSPEAGNLMASDFPANFEGDDQKAMSVSVELKSAERAEEIYEALKTEDGVIMPFGPTFFSPGMGMTKDRFGTHWIITTTPAA